MTERDPDPYVFYTVMRTSLGMHGGKIVAQGQHAYDYFSREVMRIIAYGARTEEEAIRFLVYRTWSESVDHAKVVLGATDDEFEEVKQENPLHFLVVDLGYTQVAPNTETCLALWPRRKSQRSPLLQRLRPLRRED